MSHPTAYAGWMIGFMVCWIAVQGPAVWAGSAAGRKDKLGVRIWTPIMIILMVGMGAFATLAILALFGRVGGAPWLK